MFSVHSTVMQRSFVQVMLTIGRGQHGSTYGGNPVAARVALAALQVIVDENLVENSYKLGQLLRHELQTIQSRIVTEVTLPSHEPPLKLQTYSVHCPSHA